MVKRKTVVVLLVIVAVIFGAGGYLVGASFGDISIGNSAENSKAYQQGWNYWFSGYGTHGEGMEYVEYYEMGRHYDSKFEDTRDAFFAGYKDGFYYVNHHEPENYDEAIQRGYEEYYR